MHVVARVAVLHPVIGCCGNNQEYIPHAGTEQPSSHQAVHPVPTDGLTEKIFLWIKGHVPAGCLLLSLNGS